VVTLTATDRDGASAQASATISVRRADLVVLSAQLSNRSVVLSWPASLTSFRLQETASLEAPVQWSDVASSPVVTSDRVQVVVPLSGASRFFRLQKP
jgi:hypothetical protein